MKKSRKKNAPYMSEPVISRKGKIGRVSIEDKEEKKVKNASHEKADKKDRFPLPVKSGEMSISDGEFLGSKAVKAKKNRGIHTVKSDVRRPFPVVTVIACVICTLLFMSLVFNLVRINEFTKDVSGMRGEVAELQKKKVELSAKLDEKNSVDELKKYIEERADSMGMVEEGKMNPPVAVTPEKTERIEDFDAGEESEAVISTVLNALAQNFRDAIAIFSGNE